MKILLYENYITNQPVLDQGILQVKQALDSIKFPYVIERKVIQKDFTSIQVSSDVVNHGYMIQPNEIGMMAGVDRNYDGWFLVYDADKLTPKHNGNSVVYHPVDNGQLMQMPCQWFNMSPEVFCAYFLHELDHLMFGKSRTRDITHLPNNRNLDPVLYDKYIASATSLVPFYLYLLETMKEYWGAYVVTTQKIYPIIKRGSKGEFVKELQTILGGLVVDGDFGPMTEKIVIAYQRSNKLVPDGIVGKMTWSILKKNPKLATKPVKSLVEAIIQAESNGDDYAFGDRTLKHPAYGAMQIRQPLVDDVNRRFKTNYTAKDCWGNRRLSLELFDKYFQIYKHNKTDEQKARAWNGGGNWQLLYGKKGYEKYSKVLDAYWGKIKVLL